MKAEITEITLSHFPTCTLEPTAITYGSSVDDRCTMKVRTNKTSKKGGNGYDS